MNVFGKGENEGFRVLQEQVCDAEGVSQSSIMWTVDREFEQSIQHVNQTSSGGSYVAIFTLRMTPTPDDAEVRFAYVVNDEDAKPWIPFIEEGVRSFVEQRAAEGRPVGYFSVTLVKIRVHPIDSKGRRFKQAAEIAMAKAFESHGILLRQNLFP